MEYAVVPLFFGVVTGLVGRSKGSSFVIWFIVGALLPAIGLLAAIASRSDKQDPRRECPNCNAVVGIAVQVCPRCGEDMDYPEELIAPRGFEFVESADDKRETS